MASDVMGQVLRFTLIPVGATILGGVGAAFVRPGAHLRSIVQHLAAGVVFAAAATELLPDVISRHQPMEVAIGFGLGLGAMLLVRWLGRRVEGDQAGEASGVRVVALLYLVTEELLTEAHDEPETPFTTAAFFVGFLVLLLLRMVTDGPSIGNPP